MRTSLFRARRERPHTFPLFHAGLLAALVFLSVPAFAAMPPPPVPGPVAQAQSGQPIIFDVQKSLMWDNGITETWLVTGRVTTSDWQPPRVRYRGPDLIPYSAAVSGLGNDWIFGFFAVVPCPYIWIYDIQAESWSGYLSEREYITIP